MEAIHRSAENRRRIVEHREWETLAPLMSLPGFGAFMSTARFYPIGTPGVPWGDAERTAWRERQVVSRRHQDDVVTRVEALADRFEIVRYGQLTYGADTYPLLALKSRTWDPARP